MARKALITEEALLSSAFDLIREEGFEQVTARKLAAKAGCSTQPIFRLYESMEQLIGEVYARAIRYFAAFYHSHPGNSGYPFVSLGMAYIRFASEEKQLFRLLFLSQHRGEKSMYELLNGEDGTITREAAHASKMGCAKPQELFMKMWIFVHGAACMTITGDYDLTEAQTKSLLESSCKAWSGIER